MRNMRAALLRQKLPEKPHGKTPTGLQKQKSPVRSVRFDFFGRKVFANTPNQQTLNRSKIRVRFVRQKTVFENQPGRSLEHPQRPQTPQVSLLHCWFR